MGQIRLVDGPQFSLLPLASVGTVENHLAQIVGRVQRLAPDLDGRECLGLLSELALVQVRLDSIELAIRSRVEHAAKRHGYLAS